MSRRSFRSVTRSRCSSAIGCVRTCVLMMNSSRARPTPSFGRNDKENASAGFATFIIMRVRGRAHVREVRPLDAHGEPTTIDEALFAFRARDRHLIAAS